MPFTYVNCSIPGFFHQIGDSENIGVQKVRYAMFPVKLFIKINVMYIVTCRELPGHKGYPAGSTNCCIHIKLGKTRSFFKQPINIGCLYPKIPRFITMFIPYCLLISFPNDCEN